MNCCMVLVGGLGDFIQATPAIDHLCRKGTVTVECLTRTVGAWDVLRRSGITVRSELGAVPSDYSQFDHVFVNSYAPVEPFDAVPQARRLAPLDGTEPEHLYYLRLIGTVFADLPDKIRFWAVASPVASTDLRGHAAIHPGSKPKYAAKRWPYFRELTARLVERGLKVTVVGRSHIDELDGFPSQAQMLVDQSTTDLGGCLKSAALLIANDSGIMHYANALGVPVVGIFGPTSVLMNCPPGVVPVHGNVSCSPCQFGPYWPKCPNETARRCLTSISVDFVLEACLPLIRGRL
jgi:ADP-heptose:LPS heptosyltransferase